MVKGLSGFMTRPRSRLEPGLDDPVAESDGMIDVADDALTIDEERARDEINLVQPARIL